MAKIHDLFIVELAEVIKGYGNEPDDKDPFRLSEFYRFYELPNIAVSRENFEKMRPIEPERKTGEWIVHQPFEDGHKNCNVCIECSCCRTWFGHDCYAETNFCPNCGADMKGEQNEQT